MVLISGSARRLIEFTKSCATICRFSGSPNITPSLIVNVYIESVVRHLREVGGQVRLRHRAVFLHGLAVVGQERPGHAAAQEFPRDAVVLLRRVEPVEEVLGHGSLQGAALLCRSAGGAACCGLVPPPLPPHAAATIARTATAAATRTARFIRPSLTNGSLPVARSSARRSGPSHQAIWSLQLIRKSRRPWIERVSHTVSDQVEPEGRDQQEDTREQHGPPGHPVQARGLVKLVAP